MSDNYDQLALSWVRKEINNTLDQARQGLERFSEDPQDQTQIQFCINCLHQVNGTLHMLHFSGAEKLTAEMESLAESMSKDESCATEKGFEVLMRALLQLPGYLERLEDGQRDIPLVLLPLINEVRLANKLQPIAESELFSANTADIAPPQVTEQVSNDDKTISFQENAKKLRAHFQKGLTGILRDQEVKQSFARIHKVLLRLEALTEGKPVSRLWWVADGFIFAIIQDRSYKSKEAKQLLGQIDKQIKRLSDQGTNAMTDTIEESLLSQLLYFVARSNSTNPRVIELKKEFNLEQSLAESEEVKKSQAKLSQPDTTAIINVSEAINEELVSVKEQLDLFVRGTANEPAQLQTLVDSLVRISDTLTLLELAIPRDVVRQQINSLQKLIDKQQVPSDAVVMDVAGALLFVEANLKNINLDSITQSSEEIDPTQASQQHAKEIQLDEATKELIKVARRSMQSAKDNIINYIASGFDKNTIEEVPTLLDEVLGGVKIVQFDSIINILEVTKSFIEQKIIASRRPPKEEHLDALADVITCVEYYLETSEEGVKKGLNSILKGSIASIETLEKLLEEDNLEVGSDEATEQTQEDELTEVVPVLSAASEKQVDETLIDQEVLEIFLEEVEEEIQVIDEMSPRWINDVQDNEALTTLRRSFHTLKGSGRLVGAHIISDVSWEVENLLNKVIQDNIPAETPVTSVLNEALSFLPTLVKAFSEGHSPDCDYQQLIAKAQHIALGKPLADFDFEQKFDIPTISVVDAVSEQGPEDMSSDTEAELDPVLLEIFTNEAETHMTVIDDYLASSPADGTVAVTDDLIRALHTLKGSAHMAGIHIIAHISGPWEKFSRLVKGSNHRFERPVIDLLIDTKNCLSEGLSLLKEGQPFVKEGREALFEKIDSLGSSSGTSGTLPAKQRDQRLVSIFLTEGSDILHEVVKLNERLQSEPDNIDIKKAIYSELHTFFRGSQMLSIDELELLSTSTDRLSKFVMEKSTLPEGFHLLLIEVVEVLTGMLNRIASQEDIDSPQVIMEKVEEWIGRAQVTEAPNDMDIELVELFVEEGEELIEAAEGLLERWKENLNNKDINIELRRVYHTLKGSSRMAGAMSIGELAYAIEDIFNTVVDFGRDLATIDYDVALLTTNKLAEMIAILKSLSWPTEAEKEVALVRQLLSSDGLQQSELESFKSQVIETQSLITKPAQEMRVETSESEAIEPVKDKDVIDESVTLMDNTLEENEFDEQQEMDVEIPTQELSVNEESLEQPIKESLQNEAASESALEKEITESEKADEEILEVQEEASLSEKLNEIDEEVKQSIESAKQQEVSNEVKVEDTISPVEPVTVTGEVQKIELDEDGEEVLEIYLEEAEELLIAMDEALHDWSDALGNKDAIDVLQRTLHTFKGGARLSDLAVLGNLTHEMETYFERVNGGQLVAKQEDVKFLLQGYDIIEGLVNEVKLHRQMTVPEDYMQALDALIKGKDVSQKDKKASSKAEKPTKKAKAKKSDDSVQTQAEPAASPSDNKAVPDIQQKAARPADVVRVSSNQLEGLVNLAGETSIFRSRLEQQVVMLRYNLEEMSSTVERLREQLRNLDIETDAQISYRKEVSGGNEYEDFDPLEMDRYTRQQELTRGLNESSVDLVSLKDALDGLASDSETLLLQQGRVNTEMQESLMRTRMTPFESLVPRLRRMVRQISTELGKTIELSISADGEMDRNVLERLIAPLEHMLRNAMDHGIESPAERKTNSKSETGSVNISLYREGSEVYVKIQDDGRGLNLKAIRNKAIEKELITDSSDLTDHELQQLILEAGFSTAEQVTQISGRGVGMDVVSSEIKQMGGVIEIDSTEGVGTTFTVKLPFSVSINQALMVQLGEEVFAIPLSNIEGIVRVSPFELEEYYASEDSSFKYAGIDYSMYYLGHLLDHSRSVNLQNTPHSLPVLLLHGAEHPTAMQVDELLGSREIVVKSIGSQLSSISGLSGATILGDGRVVLILDMPALIRRIDANLEQDDKVLDVQAAEEEERAVRVMVVDDSITVRKVTTRLLERHDFEVITAKDGVDALSVLTDQQPDVMLLDIEMPRMDGFELATIIRHDEKLKDLPIIMITSRTGEKHRARAEQIGVNQYMGKPYSEVDLIESISALLPTRV